jgi:ribose transport system substrate-binding protein
LTTFERRQRLLELVQKQPGIRVPEIARMLSVSQGTVRNDLRALAEAKQLVRVRGGAVAELPRAQHSPAFSARARVQAEAKRRMARWAADLVEDGDTILFDASTTVHYLAHFLQDCRNLTVITNGVEVARSLAQNPSNTVILLGGVLRADGTSVTGPISEQVLEDLHIKTAFLSSTGIALDSGLYEVDIDEARLKRKMIAAAKSVVALIDSSKFGKVDLTPFARLDQISHIFIDDGLSQAWIDQLRQTSVPFTICAEDSVAAYNPSDRANGHYRIGFANLTEQSPMCVDVRRGLERAAHDAGNIDLIIADNQLSGKVAMQVAERLLEQNLDLMIEYQIDEQAGNRIIDRFRRANVPVIAVDIPMIGATFFGVDNYRAGHMAGVALGEWIKSRWGGEVDRVIILIEPRAGTLPAARIQGQLDGLQFVIGEVSSDKQITLDCGNTAEISEKQMLAALKKLSEAHRLAVISFNDDAAIGALNAASRLHRQSDVVIVGQGADRRVREALHDADARIIGSTAYQPELYGEKLVALALKILRGDPVPPAVYMEHTFIRAMSETESA